MSTATMAKKKTSGGLPSIERTKAEAPVEEVEVRETESRTVSKTTPEDQVVWVTISVPVFTGGDETFAHAHLPERIDSGPRLMPRHQRLSAKRLIRGLNDTGQELSDGTICKTNRTTAIKWLLEQISDAFQGKCTNGK